MYTCEHDLDHLPHIGTVLPRQFRRSESELDAPGAVDHGSTSVLGGWLENFGKARVWPCFLVASIWLGPQTWINMDGLVKSRSAKIPSFEMDDLGGSPIFQEISIGFMEPPVVSVVRVGSWTLCEVCCWARSASCVAEFPMLMLITDIYIYIIIYIYICNYICIYIILYIYICLFLLISCYLLGLLASHVWSLAVSNLCRLVII